MADAGLRQIFRDNLVPRKFFLQAIESGSTSGGIPDLYFTHVKGCGWVECKATSGMAVSFRPQQIGWLEAHARYGGRGFVAVRKLAKAGPRREAADDLWLFPAGAAREVSDNGLGHALAVFHGTGGPSSWDWADLSRLLTGYKGP
jgi:hypothetical protein